MLWSFLGIAVLTASINCHWGKLSRWPESGIAESREVRVSPHGAVVIRLSHKLNLHICIREIFLILLFKDNQEFIKCSFPWLTLALSRTTLCGLHAAKFRKKVKPNAASFSVSETKVVWIGGGMFWACTPFWGCNSRHCSDTLDQNQIS